MILFIATLSMIISVALVVLNSVVGSKSEPSREKLSAFECGFDPKSQSRLPFSLHFFLVALIFLIFDVEITILLPIPLIYKFSMIYFIDKLMMFFVVILIFGTLIEWLEGSLDWSY